jgi:hypothetical protein
MTEQVVYPLINGDAARATILDACGVPAYGDAVQVASDGFIQIAVTANYDDGTEINIKNAKGRACVKRAAEPELSDLSVAITFCAVDPAFYTALTGFPQIVDDSGRLIGFRVNRGVRPNDIKVALETWQDAFADAACDDDGEVPYGYHLWPFLSGGRIGDWTIENNAVNFVVTGMITKDNPGWGEGPYEVASTSLGAAQALFDAVEALDHQITFRTVIAPPENTNGLIPLDDPDDPDATTATAGIPGTFNGVRPATLTLLNASSIAGSGGVTPWTTGQFVYLGDGSKAHWAGSGGTPKWVVGAAS